MADTVVRYLFLMFISPALSLLGTLLSGIPLNAKKWLSIIFITIYGSIITFGEGADGTVHWAAVYEYYLDKSFNQ